MLLERCPMRVFWPSTLPRHTLPGVVVGWQNSPLEYFVLTILEAVESRNVEYALRTGVLYRNNQHPVSQLFELCCISSLYVLGWSNPVEPPSVMDPSRFCAYTSSSSRFPRIWSPIACKHTLQIVLYETPYPTRMQYTSLNPIPLALEDNVGRLNADLSTGLGIDDADEDRERQRKARLVSKLKLHSVVPSPASHADSPLLVVLNQINCACEMSSLVQSNVGLIGVRPKRSLSVSERVVESASTIRNYVVASFWDFATVWLLPGLRRSFVGALLSHRVLAELILRVLEWRLRPDHAALRDISATAQQIDIRLQQFCYWPFQYFTLRKRKDVWESVTHNHPDYIRFYNSLWLVANDVIMGIALGLYIIDHADWVADQINLALNTYTVDGLRRMISWLMDWPAGLKLNNELAAFLGDLFLWVIDYWAGCVESLGPLLPHMISFVGASGFAGATMPISLCSDLVSILTVHIYCFYTASARIYNWQLMTIISLFHLFRGKKRNVLRNRIDSCDYDLDQLLLGTILFTLLFFLLPTVAVFYLTFASARMAIISLKATLDALLACLNHFPLFALMLRLKDCRRLPGGIRFELDSSPSSPPVDPSQIRTSSPERPPNEPTTSKIYLHSIPLSFRLIFQPYFQLGHRLRKHYISPSVILCLATGRFVPPIHRKNLYSLQYSMLPLQRAGVGDMWDLLVGGDTKSAASQDTRRGSDGDKVVPGVPRTAQDVGFVSSSRTRGGSRRATPLPVPSSSSSSSASPTTPATAAAGAGAGAAPAVTPKKRGVVANGRHANK